MGLELAVLVQVLVQQFAQYRGYTPGLFVSMSKEMGYGKMCLYVCENTGAIRHR